MANEFNINRVAFGNVTFPANTSDNSTVTLTANAGDAYVPKGAIIQAIHFRPGGALTNMSNMVDGTINVLAGAEPLGSNNRKCSEGLLAGSRLTMAVVAASGGAVTAGGKLNVMFASSNSKRTGISADFDVYVEYLYSGEYDSA